MHLLLASSATGSALMDMPILNKGLFTALFGLVGVFLVLTLFFVSIKLIQRPGRKPSETKE
jgi:hypothetical protein